jgi:hypothetical protein
LVGQALRLLHDSPVDARGCCAPRSTLPSS